MPPTQTGFQGPLVRTCAGCGNAATKLKVCQQCGSAAYCSPACQKADWKTHKTFCKMCASTYTAEDGDGARRLLFDRAFGGAYSLIQRARYLEVGDGVLVADLSHPVAEFCGANRAQDDARGCRSVKFSYVAKAYVGGLAHTSLASDQPDTLLDGAMGAVEHMRKEMKKVQPDTEPEMFFVLALREPHKRGLSVHMMTNWLGPEHSIIPVYLQLRRRLPNAAQNELTLEWEYRTDYSSYGPMQEMLHLPTAPVGPKFYAECLELWEAHRKSKSASPWPNGECLPPFAKQVDLRCSPSLPAHKIGSHAAATPPLLDKRVCVVGLVSKVELNGVTGMAQSFDSATGRYTVMFKFEQRESVVAIKGGNLELVEDPGGGTVEVD